MRRRLSALLLLAATALGTSLPSTPAQQAPTTLPPLAQFAPPDGGYEHRFVETFDSISWWEGWGESRTPRNTAVLAEPNGNRLLHVRISALSHDGSSFTYPTGDADEVHLRYRFQLSPNFSPAVSFSNVKLPGFGAPLRNAWGECLAGCGGEPSDGVTSWSARSIVNMSGRPGWYVYHADMPQTHPSFGWGLGWRAPSFEPGRWYTMDMVVRMNTPGLADGQLQAWVDGTLVFDGRAFEFRAVDALHVGNAWFDIYYGGAGVAPTTMWVRFDDVLVEW
jgi:hypothetical protein